MLQKLLSALYSTRLMAVLFIGFAAAMAAGTFIEDAYNTETARVLVYNTWWFEAIMGFFLINFFGNIKRYQLHKREKWATLLLHLSWIFIIIGAFVTRYISYEGLMPNAQGAKGISMLLVDAHSKGITKSPLKKMGWWASDTAHLHFDNVKVPVSHLLGEENAGFKVIMNNFNMERFWLAAMAYGYAMVCYEEALDWAKQRQTFGKRLVDHQVVRHKLVDMATQLTTTRALLEDTAYRMGQKQLQGADLIAQISMSKNVATRTMQFCADAAVQTLGGMGFMRGTKSERIYREVKVNMIGGGAEEIMKDLISKQLGY
jgi:alkylation response protein AidB-like acyl-CoA dehydrogenase